MSIKRIEDALADLGASHEPRPGWEQRVRLACELTARSAHPDSADAVKRAEVLLTTATQLCGGDPVATNESLAWAVVLHAATHGDSAATVDAWLHAAIVLIESSKISPMDEM